MKQVLTLIFALGLSLSLLASDSIIEPYNDFVADVKVYPNPSTTGTYQLEFERIDPNEAITVKVYNLIGQQVYLQHISDPEPFYKIALNLHHVPKGIYMLELSNGEKKITRRLSYI